MRGLPEGEGARAVAGGGKVPGRSLGRRMPELPVLTALAERLEAAVGGAVCDGLVPLSFTALASVVPPPDALSGRCLAGVGRRGKFLLFDFSGPRLAVHLGQAGRVDIESPPKSTRPKNALARLRFQGDYPAVLFKEWGTERKARLWVLAAGDDGPLAALGPEPGSAELAAYLRGADDKRRLHTMLRDQRTMAGVGRGHADDVLNRARLSPMRSLASLDAAEREALLDALLADLDEKLELERGRRGGLPPKLGEHWAVHGRAGTPCPRCGATLARVSYEDYEITYCPPCQTGGKLLADRRLSRFLDAP